MTVQQLISRSLQRLGVLGKGQTASAADAQFALDSLNNLIQGWSLDRLLTFTITRTTWTLVSGTASYTVGTGGTVNVARPSTMNMQGCNVQFIDTSTNPNIELPLAMLTDDSYQWIPQKTYSATYPTSWYFNPTYTSSAAPYATLTFWPVPNVSYLTGVFYSPVAAAEVTLAQTLALPPGYQRFYETNLALDLADVFPVSDAVLARVTAKARESRADLEKVNTRLSDLNVDLGLVPERRHSNIYTGLC